MSLITDGSQSWHMTSSFSESTTPALLCQLLSRVAVAGCKHVKPRERRNVVTCHRCLFSEACSLSLDTKKLFLLGHIHAACCSNQPLPTRNMPLGRGSHHNTCYSNLQFFFYWITAFSCSTSIDSIPTSFLKMEEDWAPGVLILLFPRRVLFQQCGQEGLSFQGQSITSKHLPSWA